MNLNILRTLIKGDLIVHDYMKKLKENFDALIGSGQVVIEKELIKYIIDGI